VENAVSHLQSFFADARASEIDRDRIDQYVRYRKEAGAAPATINRQLGALRRSFRLAQSAGEVPYKLAEDNRREDFFAADEYQSMLHDLPEHLRPVIQTAYITGWRINSEILTRQKQNVALHSGCLRIEATQRDCRKHSVPMSSEPQSSRRPDRRTFP
jgi:integrase